MFRWGIVSTAEINGKVFPALRDAGGSQVIAIASRSPERAKEWADKFSPGLRIESYESILEASDIDGLYIPLCVFISIADLLGSETSSF